MIFISIRWINSFNGFKNKDEENPVFLSGRMYFSAFGVIIVL